MVKCLGEKIALEKYMSEFLYKLTCAMAVEMEEPKPFGTLHLIFLLISVPLIIFAAWKLRKLSDKGADRLLFFVGLFLAVTEIFKQIYYYYQMADGSYYWTKFPFQLCSVPMYLCLMMPLLKKGKIKDGICDFMMSYNMLGGLMTILYPATIFTSKILFNMHSLIWHALLVFVGLFLTFSRRGGGGIKKYVGATFTFLGLCALAFTMNLTLGQIAEARDQSFNMFYIGPGISDIVVFSDIGEKFGWWVGTLAYIPAVCLGSFLIYLLFDFIGRKTNEASQRKIAQATE